MLHAGERQSGVTLDLWLLRGPSRRELLLTSTTHARVSRPNPKRNRRYDNDACLCVASKVTSSWTAAKASRVRKGKAPMARAVARPPYSSSSSQAVPLSIPGARPPG